MDLKEVGCGMDWIDLAQNRDTRGAIVNAVLLDTSSHYFITAGRVE